MPFWNKCILFAVLLAASCRSPVSPVTPVQTKDVVMVAGLVDDSVKVAQYLACHRKVWPEVEAGFRKAGYRNIRLYRFNRTLVMVVTVPANADLAAMGRAAEAYDPKCKEWNLMMGAYQVGLSGTRPGQKWAEANLFYQFNRDSTGH